MTDFIKEETLATKDYLLNFYPFNKPNLEKRGTNAQWDICGDKDIMALSMTFSDKPMAVNMSLQREYAEPYD